MISVLQRLRSATKQRQSLLLHKDGLENAEAAFRNTVGVPADLQNEKHPPFFTVDPEAI